jgi:hypothetical protein
MGPFAPQFLDAATHCQLFNADASVAVWDGLRFSAQPVLVVNANDMYVTSTAWDSVNNRHTELTEITDFAEL